MGRQQPYMPKGSPNGQGGRYLSFDANPGLKMSPVGRFTMGFGQGVAEAQGATGAAPAGTAGNIGYFLGKIFGSFIQ